LLLFQRKSLKYLGSSFALSLFVCHYQASVVDLEKQELAVFHANSPVAFAYVFEHGLLVELISMAKLRISFESLDYCYNSTS